MLTLYPYPAEIIAEIDARLMAIDPRFAEHNRQVAPHSPALQIIADSGLTMHCPKCGQEKALIDFPVVDRIFSATIPLEKNVKGTACWDCLYVQALTKLMANGHLKNNPVKSLSYVPVQKAFSYEWIVLGKCFCGAPAEDWHHYAYWRPLIGQCYCKAHHKQLHKIICSVWRGMNYIPDHQKRKYYLRVLDKATGKYTSVPRPEFAAEILAAQQRPTLRQQQRIQRDRQLAHWEREHIKHLFKRFGKESGQVLVDALRAKKARKAEKARNRK